MLQYTGFSILTKTLIRNRRLTTKSNTVFACCFMLLMTGIIHSTQLTPLGLISYSTVLCNCAWHMSIFCGILALIRWQQLNFELNTYFFHFQRKMSWEMFIKLQ